MHIQFLPKEQYLRTVILGVIASMLVVGTAAFLGRATLNLHAALTDKPDLAVYLLLEKEKKNVTSHVLLRESTGSTLDGAVHMRKDYLVETDMGAMLIQLEKTEGEGNQWAVTSEEPLHSDN